MEDLLEARKKQIMTVARDETGGKLTCEAPSLAGSVSQRACVFCGSRVVLYPIADAVHIVHGPVGCAAYTWDIRGALSSGPQLHRLSFSTDLREQDIIFGGAKKLETALRELIGAYAPKAVFIYATCIVGLIGDDLDAVARKIHAEFGIPVLPVHSEGFKGTKKDGYKAAGDALLRLMSWNLGEAKPKPIPISINILGEFNLAGEAWMLRSYYERMGVKVVSVLTGDSRVEEIQQAPYAELNIVQCSGSMTNLAQKMKQRWDIPFVQASYFGLEDVSEALYTAARHFGLRSIMENTRDLVRTEISALMPKLNAFRKELEGKRAAIYVGGAFKSHSLVKALRTIGMKTVLVGSQTGNADDYKALETLCDPGTVIVDDSNPFELSKFLLELDVDLFIGGVKERPMALKLGVAFCDHNHERKIALAGFEGMLNFAKEIRESLHSPVWALAPRRTVSHD